MSNFRTNFWPTKGRPVWSGDVFPFFHSLRFLQAGYRPPCLHGLFVLVSWFWPILWHLGSRRYCGCSRCEFYVAEYCTLRSSFPLFLVFGDDSAFISMAVKSWYKSHAGFIYPYSAPQAHILAFFILYHIVAALATLVLSSRLSSFHCLRRQFFCYNLSAQSSDQLRSMYN
jgi:hypothetical protein